MHTTVADNAQNNYTITTPGVHVFSIYNITTNAVFTIATENAQVYIFGLYNMQVDEKHKLSITIHHKSRHSQSRTLIKSILRDCAQFTCIGTIRVDKLATNTTATLTNHNLVIGHKTHVNTTPQLEVLPATAYCRHDATTTQIDSNQLIYLATRGINTKTATKLLVDGFVSDIDAQIQNISARQ